MPDARVLITLTRWHYDDIVGRLLRLRDEDPTADDWTVLRLPAIKGEEQTHPDDPREEGEALWPDRYGLDFLAKQRAALGPYAFACTPAETPILMGDWTQKRIEDVRAGDEIVGFYRGTPEARGRLIPATVKQVMSYVGMVCELEMESGRKVRCTPCHRWYTGRKDASHREYDVPKVGRRLCYVQPCEYPTPSDEERMMWAWLSGIVDGEGHIGGSDPDGRARTRILNISQSPGANPEVFARIGEVLDSLGLPYTLHVRGRPDKRWSDSGEYIVHDIGTVFPRMIANYRPAKWRQMVRCLFGRAGRFIRQEDAVRSIKYIGERPVYALETTTGNYIAWGYASSNSLYQQSPTPREGGLFTAAGLSRRLDAPPIDVMGRVRYWDKGYSSEGDYTAGVLMSKLHDGTYVVEDVARLRAGPRERNDFIKSTCAADDERHTRMAPPSNHPSAGKSRRVLQIIEQPPGAGAETTAQLVRELAGHAVRAYRPVGSKEERAEPLAAQCGAGNVALVRATWNAAFVAELLTFPAGEHDDMLDGASGSFNHLASRTKMGITIL